MISVAPGKVTCTTCHKVPISGIPDLSQKAQQFDKDHRSDFQPGSMSIWAGVLAFLPNGTCIFVCGFKADNVEEQRENSMNLWRMEMCIPNLYV